MYAQVKSDSQPRSKISLVQFTDLHLDFDYVVGANNECKNVLCCRAENGMAKDPNKAAGVYGTVSNCDVPVALLDKMTEKIN